MYALFSPERRSNPELMTVVIKRIDVDALTPGVVALVGVPWDEQSSYLRGSAAAPAAIRAALASPSTNLCTEAGRDLAAEPRFVDVGDLAIGAGAAALVTIEQGMTAILRAGASVISLGGDHAVTYPLVRAHAHVHGPLTLLHFDAHPDLYRRIRGQPALTRLSVRPASRGGRGRPPRAGGHQDHDAASARAG